MTRQRKELQKKMDQLYMQEQAEHELGCGFFSQEISNAFHPYWEALHKEWAATYGRTVQEHKYWVYERQSEAYDAGRILWSPCSGMGIM